jgi:hypothetical protein
VPAEKTLAWTLIALTIIWEDFNFSGQQTLQRLDPLVRCTISIAFKSHYVTNHGTHIEKILISPRFRATFSAPLGNALIQVAKKATNINADHPGQIGSQLDLTGSLQEKTEVLRRAATILDEMGNAIDESEGEQVDRGEERACEHWDNLRNHFEEQVTQLEKSLK